MLVAIPDSAELDAAREKSNLIRTLEGLEQQVQIAILEGTVTLNRLSDALLEQPFHGFHFIGHGGFEHDRAFLQLNSEQGDAEWIADDRLVSLFANHPTLKLVFLNSCQGAQTSLTAPLAGLAHRLIKQGVPAVVAMQYAVYDDAAVLFSREFYQALFKGQARGRVEFAVSHARNRLLGEFPGERDIGAPVLFMRASEGLLFNVAAGDRLADLPLARERITAPKPPRTPIGTISRNCNRNVRRPRVQSLKRLWSSRRPSCPDSNESSATAGSS
ncbi:MAG: CHAT domain-containing protein [Candidatus Competibacteraceae bacterium]|nr:CHAT domain-containing protein [Candidatus Competibacteraceae bacterium]